MPTAKREVTTNAMPAEGGVEEARLRARFERSRLPQAEVDAAGVFCLVNDALCELVGLSREELLGQRPAAITHPDDPGEADRILALVLAGDSESAQYERLLLGRGGRPVPVLLDVTLLRDESGAAVGASSHYADLTALRESERRRQRQEELHDAFSRLSQEAAIVADEEGTLLYASPAVTTLLGHDVEDVVLHEGWDFVHPEDLEQVRAVYESLVREGGTRTFLLRLRSSDSGWRWVEQTARNELAGGIGGIVSTLRDVTERVEATEALRASEQRYRAIAETAEEGIWAVGPEGQTQFANARMAELLGLPLEDVYGRNALDLLDPEQATDAGGRLVTRGQRGPERYEFSYAHPDGSMRWWRVAASPLLGPDGQVEASLAMVSDATEMRRTQEELGRAALHDQLTGLPNRVLLLDRLSHALTRGTSTAVLLVDLDHFRQVNVARGYHVGDALLAAVAGRLVEVVRPGDTVGRLGGDQFVVVAEEVNEQQATALAEELTGALSAGFAVAEPAIRVSASVGAAVSSTASAGDLLHSAETALHAAKTAGGGRVRLLDRVLEEDTAQRYSLGTELREALRESTLGLHYQPVVSLQTGRVLGMEGLARWVHPERGPVPAVRLVSVAVATGLTDELDRWVVHRALQDAGRLRAQGRIPADAYVAVNLATPDLSGLPDAAELASWATDAGIPTEQVVLEITEPTVARDNAATARLLRALRDAGFQIALDDFGTGHGSLAHLRDLPVTSLKIDAGFVADIGLDGDALAIVASIIDLARAVGMSAVAEGVETIEQAAVLRRLGCGAGQGRLWSWPLPIDEVGADGSWLRAFTVAEPPSAVPVAAVAEEAAVTWEHGLERLLELHRQGASLATVAAALNSEGFRAPSGLRWHRASVARVVAGAAYPELPGATAGV